MPKIPKINHPLRQLRKSIPGMTQERFAAALGVSKSTIQAIELGKRSLNKKLSLRIMYSTGINPDSLRRKEGKPMPFFGVRFRPLWPLEWNYMMLSERF